MADTKIFYAITAGEESDYHIITITDDKERAEELKRAIPYSDIEEIPDAPIIQSGYWLWEIHRDLENESITVKRAGSSFSFDMLNEVRRYSSCNTTVFVLAMDEPHALKIACDLLAQSDAKWGGRE